MTYILIAIAVISITVLAIIKFILGLTQVTVEASLTSRFQDAEFILNHHKAPESWRKPASLFTRAMQGRVWSVTQEPHMRVLSRLDDLIIFFEHSRFFETPDAKEQLLDELKLERTRWENLSFEAIFTASA